MGQCKLHIFWYVDQEIFEMISSGMLMKKAQRINETEFFYWIFFPFSWQFCIHYIVCVNVFILFCILIKEGVDLDLLNCSVIFYCLPLLPLSIYAVHCIKNQSKCGNQQKFPFFCKSKIFEAKQVDMRTLQICPHAA